MLRDDEVGVLMLDPETVSLMTEPLLRAGLDAVRATSGKCLNQSEAQLLGIAAGQQAARDVALAAVLEAPPAPGSLDAAIFAVAQAQAAKVAGAVASKAARADKK